MPSSLLLQRRPNRPARSPAPSPRRCLPGSRSPANRDRSGPCPRRASISQQRPWPEDPHHIPLGDRRQRSNRAHGREEPQLREPLVGNLRREPDVELDLAEASRFPREESAERAVRPVDVADQLLHVEPDRHRVVAVSRSRYPSRLLPREHTRDLVEVPQVLEVQRLVDPNQPGLVTEQLANGDPALSVLGELGPVLGDGCLVVDPAARVRDATVIAARPLVVELTTTIVSSFHGSSPVGCGGHPTGRPPSRHANTRRRRRRSHSV